MVQLGNGIARFGRLGLVDYLLKVLLDLINAWGISEPNIPVLLVLKGIDVASLDRLSEPVKTLVFVFLDLS